SRFLTKLAFTRSVFVELTPFLFGIRLKPHPHAAAWSKGSGDGYGSLFCLTTSAKLTLAKFNFDQEFARPVPASERPHKRGCPGPPYSSSCATFNHSAASADCSVG